MCTCVRKLSCTLKYVEQVRQLSLKLEEIQQHLVTQHETSTLVRGYPANTNLARLEKACESLLSEKAARVDGHDCRIAQIAVSIFVGFLAMYFWCVLHPLCTLVSSAVGAYFKQCKPKMQQAKQLTSSQLLKMRNRIQYLRNRNSYIADSRIFEEDSQPQFTGVDQEEEFQSSQLMTSLRNRIHAFTLCVDRSSYIAENRIFEDCEPEAGVAQVREEVGFARLLTLRNRIHSLTLHNANDIEDSRIFLEHCKPSNDSGRELRFSTLLTTLRGRIHSLTLRDRINYVEDSRIFEQGAPESGMELGFSRQLTAMRDRIHSLTSGDAASFMKHSRVFAAIHSLRLRDRISYVEDGRIFH